LFVTTLPLAVARIEAERYLLPAIVAGACLAGLGAGAGTRGRPRRAGAALTGLLVAGTLYGTWAGGALAVGDTTQARARRWCERHLGSEELLVQEGYGARLATRAGFESLREGPEFAAASE